MADPRRYWFDDDKAEPIASTSGDWIKYADFEDYKAAQCRNSSAEMNAKLGVEIAEMRSRIAELEAERDMLKKRCEFLFNDNHRFIERVWLNGYRSGGDDAKGVQS